MIASWIGPAIVAERIRRAEKIKDFRIALRAEIRSERLNLSRFDLETLFGEVEERYQAEEDFSVIIPRLAKHIVFDAILGEIHILPESMIDPVVLYIRQRQVVESMAEDMRDSSFRELSKDRQLAMYRDYLGMWKVWREMAADAEKALSATNSLAADPWALKSASASAMVLVCWRPSSHLLPMKII